MRILLVVDCYLPEQKSSALLMHDLAEEFASRGHMVTLLAPSPALGAPCITGHNGAFRVVRYRTGPMKGAPLWLRGVNEMLLSATAWWRTRSVLDPANFDFVVFYSPSICFGPLVAFLKGRSRLRSYLVVRDIFPDWAVEAGVLKKGLAYWVLKLFERLQYAVADRIGYETRGSAEYFRNRGYVDKVELLRNWTRTDPVRCPPERPFRRKLGLEDKTVFLYGGNIGIAQDMDNIVRLARRMEPIGDVQFVLMGAGSEVERLKALVAAGEVKNAIILPPVDQDRYLTTISEFDVGLISLDRRLKSFSTTGKLLGYLRCGLPVLASVNPGNELMQLLSSSGAGFCSWNGDDEAFYTYAMRLRWDSVRTAMASRARVLLQTHFSIEAAADRILAVSPDVRLASVEGSVGMPETRSSCHEPLPAAGRTRRPLTTPPSPPPTAGSETYG